ncbi:MAG: NADH:ubiquinone reductase (Na(+)-transporting) subunit C [Rikenellaceae bacterium]|jgi:Na+-transporting NADH:ubiquinone oxidoreductase subunit C|nr:NADH:ubiquinone reductase (Na(+)-transporting) subunit C [Rikenellaceae bacterium]
MNKNSNAYIIAYASVLVIIVAALLAYASVSLQDRQNENVRVEKMGDILRSIGQGMDADKAPDKYVYINEQYAKYITRSYTVNTAGEVTEGTDPFAIALNLKELYDAPAGRRNLPIFESKDDGGKVLYIIPVWGSGLWGPIWGYVALESDFDTIHGAIFDHKGETPGLGAEIATPTFYAQYKGKALFEGDEMVCVTALKGSGTSAGNPHAVDAISGGTITSRAVEKMLRDCMTDYAVYFEKMRAAGAGADAASGATATGTTDTAGETPDSLTVN